MRKSKSRTPPNSDSRRKGPPPELIPKKKLRTAIERTYQLDTDPFAQRCVNCTVQDVSVDLLKLNSEDTVFTFSPGGIGQSRSLAAYGSDDPHFEYGLITQLANVGPQSKSPDVNGFKFALAALKGMAPQDPLAAMICAEIAAFHQISMMVAERLASHTPHILDMARDEQSYDRLVRTQAALTTALNHHSNAIERNNAARQVIADGARINGNPLPKVVPLDPDFVSSLFGPLVQIGRTRHGYDVDWELRFARAAFKGMAPKSYLEATICAQAVVVHSFVMMFAHRLGHSDDFAELATAEQCLNRLSRTFCTLTEAIGRHRDAADRKIATQRISAAAPRREASNGSDVTQNGFKMHGKSNGHASI